PSQHYGPEMQGDQNYQGATPSYIIWNLLQRYTKKNDLVVDPMCGSGTTIDVARDLQRRVLGYDVAPYRGDIFRADARKLPLEDGKADFVFVDPPYSTHLEYSEDPACIGKLDALDPKYYESMGEVIGEIHRILKPGRHMALYVSDSFRVKKPFAPIGFRLFALMEQYFEAVDIVAVVRHNRTLKRHHWHTEAIAGNFFLRGFNYLFIMRKADADARPKVPATSKAPAAAEKAPAERRPQGRPGPKPPRRHRPGPKPRKPGS
ncbi:MAG: class I SAM-dependent methyltransferase, partial [Candidatus Hydrogenedentes bacterium]|nr:class I SAM-dependent methyltransferase [Candidatus Hydrogenedentota bacterium]